MRSLRAGVVSVAVMAALSCSGSEPPPAQRAPTLIDVTPPATARDPATALRSEGTGSPVSYAAVARAAQRASERRIDAVTALPPASAVEESAQYINDDMPDDLLPAPVLVATSDVTKVYERPSFDSPPIGYLRAGAVVRRGITQHRTRGCAEGFYEVHPAGFVCVGRAASLDPEHKLAEVLARRPDREALVPYVYGRVSGAPPHLYNRVPSATEQRETEPSFRQQTRHGLVTWESVPTEPPPPYLEAAQPAYNLSGSRRSRSVLHAGVALAGASFALLTNFEAEGRRFAVTTDLDILPLDRLERVMPSRFQGKVLDDVLSLPVAFVMRRHARLYRGDLTKGLTEERVLAFREAVPVTGERQRMGGATYLATQDGGWILDERLTLVTQLEEYPHWAEGDAPWIDVSIEKQALIAYRGRRPVYVTLVSTGKGGADQADDTATRIGEFRIHTKHVAITMSSDDEADPYDVRDVPYVQYFDGSYAFHAAYWHDDFGTPRSHGCVNLAPQDARWLFEWTSPLVPELWHGGMSLLRGTRVRVRA